jgi:hypothetical protein
MARRQYRGASVARHLALAAHAPLAALSEGHQKAEVRKPSHLQALSPKALQRTPKRPTQRYCTEQGFLVVVTPLELRANTQGGVAWQRACV